MSIQNLFTVVKGTCADSRKLLYMSPCIVGEDLNPLPLYLPLKMILMKSISLIVKKFNTIPL